MKPVKALLLFTSFIFLFTSCNDDDDDFKFEAQSLKQTQWVGILEETYNGRDSKLSDVGIIFYTEVEGEYDVKSKNAAEPVTSRFKYSIEGKILSIPGGITLGGQWLLIESNNNKLVLEQSTGGIDAYKGILTLTRKH